MVTTAKPVHAGRIAFARNNHGYPYVAVCACGWQSLGYAAEHSARIMLDEHRTEL